MKRTIEKSVMVFMFALCCEACTLGTKQYNNDVSAVMPDDKPETLDGMRILHGDTLPGILGVVSTDNYIVTISDDRDPIFTVLTKDGTRVADFGHKGHSDAEFLTTSVLKQYTTDGCVVVNDVNAARLKLIDMHNTVKEQRTVLKQCLRMPPASLEAWFVDQDRQIILQQHTDNFLLYNKGDRIKDAKRLYDDHTPAFPLYQSRLCANSSGQKVALPMMYIDRVNFYDFETGKLSSVSMYGTSTTSDDDMHVYYCSTCTDGNKVYALYMNQSDDDSYEVQKAMEIHVFNFDGGYIRRFSVPEYIVDIDCDEENLYGVDFDGNIYRYPLAA